METPTPFADSFTDLVVYRRARELARMIFQATKAFPKEEQFSLISQIRRAARSVGAQIAEAWAKRRFPKHFASKLSDADGENQEVQHWIIVAFDDLYLSREEAERIGALSKEIGRILGNMIQKASSFCGDDYSSTLREDPNHYLVPEVTESPLNTEY
jgi:four helix bundle protein